MKEMSESVDIKTNSVDGVNPFLKLVGHDNIDNFMHLLNNRDIRCLKLIDNKYGDIKEPLYKSLLEVPNDVECLKLLQNALILNPPSNLESKLHKLKNNITQNRDDGEALNLVIELMGSAKNIKGNMYEEELLGYISAITMYILASYGVKVDDDEGHEEENVE